MRELISHIPEFLKDVNEYNAIFDAETIELEDCENNIKEIVKETSVETAETYGLTRYEKIFNVKNIASDIEERRFNLKAKMINQLPYNLGWLNSKLESLVGAGSYSINLDRENLVLTILISHLFPNIVSDLRNVIRQEIPANVALTINLINSGNITTYVGIFAHKGIKKCITYEE